MEYAVDRGEWSRIETSRAFALPLPELAPGSYDLLLRAVDINDRPGPAIEEEITIPAPRPLIASLEAEGEL